MPLSTSTPRQVLLFAGHRVDVPGRKPARLPMAKVPAARFAIERVLDELAAGADDLAYTQGAAGGDLLFAQACLARDVQLRLMLPLAEAAFIEASVLPSADGQRWRCDFLAVKAALAEPLRQMPIELGPLPTGVDVYERCNRWLLETALAHGVGRLRFICLWDGGSADLRGGTGHLRGEVERCGGAIHWIDTRAL